MVQDVISVCVVVAVSVITLCLCAIIVHSTYHSIKEKKDS